MSSGGFHMATSPPTLTPIPAPAPAIGNLEYDWDDLLSIIQGTFISVDVNTNLLQMDFFCVCL